jgi:hypothetical protein
MGKRGRPAAVTTHVDQMAPTCERCGRGLTYYTIDGRCVEECYVHGWRFCPTRRPVQVEPAKRFTPDPDRDVIIGIMYVNHQSVAAIARTFDLSEPRIRQILARIKNAAPAPGEALELDLFGGASDAA